MASAAWLLAAGGGWLAGSALQLQQAALWSQPGYVALLTAGALGWLGLRRVAARQTLVVSALLAAVGCAVLAFASTGLRAGWRLADALPAALEGRDLAVVGIVASLPQRVPGAWRFQFEVESARLDGESVRVPERLALSWYARGSSALPGLRAGQRWRLPLRLKRPHGSVNPHGFDYELHLFEQGVRATGHVRGTSDAEPALLTERAGHAVDRARQAVRDAIEAHVIGRSGFDAPGDEAPDAVIARDASGTGEAGPPGAVATPGVRETGVLAALAVGDQAAIERDDWTLYRHTGVAHLMSISGLHVTMFAWLAGLLIARLWRCSPRALRACPLPVAARWGGLLAALAYAVFAGWGVPAQRTVLMLATTTLVKSAGLRWAWPMVWASAAVVVAAVDPWALLQPGFWLSFVAVGLLLASGEARGAVRAASGVDAVADAAPAPRPGWRAALRRTLGSGLRTQAVASLGLAPLTLVFFQQVSLVGFVANLLAIPLVTLVITPLALLGVLLPPLWSAAAALVGVLNAALQALAAPAGALWSVPAAPTWAVACGLLGGALALLPLPRGVRLLALGLLLPLLAPPLARLPHGAFELTAVDVGQGSAVLLRTANHALLYDAGPRYSSATDAGERVLLPLLRALGVPRLDLLMLSHRDSDHVGGAAALLGALPVAALSSSLEGTHALQALARERGVPSARCESGRRWVWDGVVFELLHPPAAALDVAQTGVPKPNTLSCVLRVQGRWGGEERRVLLPGDIERAQEAALVAAYGADLRSDVLLVPHHGSQTSSSAVFLDAVAPRVAVVQAGHRNRFGHPAPAVLARLRERGIDVLESARCGAWRLSPAGTQCWREQTRRYWRHPSDGEADLPSPHNGVEVAKPGGSGVLR